METSVGGVLCCTLCCTPSLVLFPSSVAHPLCSAFCNVTFIPSYLLRSFCWLFLSFLFFGGMCVFVCVCVCVCVYVLLDLAQFEPHIGPVIKPGPPPPHKATNGQKVKSGWRLLSPWNQKVCVYVQSCHHSADILPHSSYSVTDVLHLDPSNPLGFFLSSANLFSCWPSNFSYMLCQSFSSYRPAILLSVSMEMCVFLRVWVCMRVIEGLRVKECGCVISSLCFRLCIFEDCMCAVQCPKLVFLTFADVCFHPVRLYQNLFATFLVSCGWITLLAKPERTLITLRTINEVMFQWL